MRELLVVVAAAMMLSLPAVAEDGSVRAAQDVGIAQYSAYQVAGPFVGSDIDVSFAATRARLRANGYRQVGRVNGDALHLKAFDPQGSEVLLTVDPLDGEIDRTDYVHPMDE